MCYKKTMVMWAKKYLYQIIHFSSLEMSISGQVYGIVYLGN